MKRWGYILSTNSPCLHTMANTAEKNAKKRRSYGRLLWGGLNVGFLLWFFLLRLYLRPLGLTRKDWVFLAVNLVVQFGATQMQLSVYEASGASSDAAVDLAAMAFAALFFAAFDRRGWIFTFFAPFVFGYFMYAGVRQALGGLTNAKAAAALEEASTKVGSAEGKGGAQRRR
jgi:hypothetical protein